MNKKKVSKQQKTGPVSGGRLRIGDNWNAITIIALSQSNPFAVRYLLWDGSFLMFS